MSTINLSVNYAGLALKNPLIISSSELTNSPQRNKAYAEAGAGAIVLKSLFEEQILMEIRESLSQGEAFDYPEAQDYIAEHVKQNHLQAYLNLIKETKKLVDIPVIASINCYSIDNWLNFTQEIQAAGADALEINVMVLETSIDFKPGQTEMMHIELMQELKKIVSIPVIFKLSKQLTNPIALANQLYSNGAKAVVMFNRSYTPDINLSKMDFHAAPVLSDKNAFGDTFRWVGIASAMIPEVQLAASGGIHETEQIIKAILAGATTTQICSIVYKQGPDIITSMLTELMLWMKENGFESISQMRGKMNQSSQEDENHFIRTQFLKYFAGHPVHA